MLVEVPLGVGECSLVVVDDGEEEDKGVWAKSCLAARKLLRRELVSSRLERYAPGLRMIEGPPETILLYDQVLARALVTIVSQKDWSEI